jgi:hypothetical protein
MPPGLETFSFLALLLSADTGSSLLPAMQFRAYDAVAESGSESMRRRPDIRSTSATNE